MVGQATNRKDLLKSSGNTADIISAILYADSQSASYTKELSAQLRKATVLDTCRAIYDFVKQNIEYKEDPDGFQFVQSPGHLYWGDKAKGKGQGDCKSMSVFCGSILQNLGIKYAFRFVSQDRSKDLHHVFIVVPDETGKTICLDCVDDYFNAHYHFSKVKDVVPVHCQNASKIGDLALYQLDQSTTNGVVKNFGKEYASWYEYLTEYTTRMQDAYNIEKQILLDKIQTDWDSVKAMAVFEPISMLLLGQRGNNKVKGYFDGMLETAALHQIMYCYWDDLKAPFPSALQQKRDQAILLKSGLLHDKVNNRITAGFKDPSKPKYFTEYNLMVFCDWHCNLTYGLPLALLLQKAYNMVNLGCASVPLNKLPYYDLRSASWKQNGASIQQLQNLELCLPFGNKNFLPVGNVYWTRGGFVNPNGCLPEDVQKFIAANPKPANLPDVATKTMKVEQQDHSFLAVSPVDPAYMVEWWNTVVVKNSYMIRSVITRSGLDNTATNLVRPGIVVEPATNTVRPDATTTIDATNTVRPGTTSNWGNNATNTVVNIPGVTSTGMATNVVRPGVSGNPKIGIAPAVIAAIITAVVTVVVSLLQMITQMLNKKKSDEQIKQDMTNYPVDFQNSYYTVDGCRVDAVNNGGGITYTKTCPDGTVQQNIDPNAPENTPANGSGAGTFMGNLKSAWPLMLAAAGIGLLLLFSSSSKKSKA